MNMDQFLKENASNAMNRLSELAKKAETKETKRAEYIVKVKKQLHPRQMKYYESPDQVKQKWSKFNEQFVKKSSDPISFFRKLSTDSWNKEKSDREARQKS